MRHDGAPNCCNSVSCGLNRTHIVLVERRVFEWRSHSENACARRCNRRNEGSMALALNASCRFGTSVSQPTPIQYRATCTPRCGSKNLLCDAPFPRSGNGIRLLLDVHTSGSVLRTRIRRTRSPVQTVQKPKWAVMNSEGESLPQQEFVEPVSSNSIWCSTERF